MLDGIPFILIMFSDLKLIDFVNKAFISTIESYLILYNIAWSINSEYLIGTCTDTWEEFVAKV